MGVYEKILSTTSSHTGTAEWRADLLLVPMVHGRAVECIARRRDGPISTVFQCRACSFYSMGAQIGSNKLWGSHVGRAAVIGPIQVETVLACLYERGSHADYAAHCHVSRARVYAWPALSKSGARHAGLESGRV